MDLLDPKIDRDSQSSIGVADPCEHSHKPTLGVGHCTLCSCPSFLADQGGQQCINRNAEGGTCNHWESEHN